MVKNTEYGRFAKTFDKDMQCFEDCLKEDLKNMPEIIPQKKDICREEWQKICDPNIVLNENNVEFDCSGINFKIKYSYTTDQIKYFLTFIKSDLKTTKLKEYNDNVCIQSGSYGQKLVYSIVKEYIANPNNTIFNNNNLRLIVLGTAGTGKSYTIAAINKLLREHNLHLTRTATTGMASIVINGETVHSVLSIPCRKIAKCDLMVSGLKNLQERMQSCILTLNLVVLCKRG